MEMKKKTGKVINKLLDLGLPLLKLSKILMYEFSYDYLKPKYGVKSKFSYMDIDSLIVYFKTDDIYKDIAEDFETKFDSSNYELDRSLLKVKNKKLIGLIKENVGRKIMRRFVGLTAKTYSYLKDDSSEDKKAKGRKKVCHKKKT